jgi:DNA polymerase III delta prime subunit
MAKDKPVSALAGVVRKNEQKPPRIVIYGPPGVGKTTFAAMAPNPIFLCVEDGLGVLEVDHFPLIQTFDELLNNLSLLWNEEHDYKTVCLDSLDWLERIIWSKVAADHAKASIEDIGYAKGYIFALEYWKQVLQGLNALREHKGILPILVSHSQVKPFNDPMTAEPYDRYSLKLHDKARALVEEWSDCILFAGYRVFTKKDTNRGIGTGERVLYTCERPGHMAKNRYNVPPELDFNFDAFMSAMAGE